MGGWRGRVGEWRRGGVPPRWRCMRSTCSGGLRWREGLGRKLLGVGRGTRRVLGEGEAEEGEADVWSQWRGEERGEAEEGEAVGG